MFPGNTWRGDRPWEGSASGADALSALNSILSCLLLPLSSFSSSALPGEAEAQDKGSCLGQ